MSDKQSNIKKLGKGPTKPKDDTRNIASFFKAKPAAEGDTKKRTREALASSNENQPACTEVRLRCGISVAAGVSTQLRSWAVYNGWTRVQDNTADEGGRLKRRQISQVRSLRCRVLWLQGRCLQLATDNTRTHDEVAGVECLLPNQEVAAAGSWPAQQSRALWPSDA